MASTEKLLALLTYHVFRDFEQGFGARGGITKYTCFCTTQNLPKSSIIAARASDLWTSAATIPEQMSSATVHLKRRCDGAGYEPTDLIFRRKLKRKNSGEDDLLKALGFKP